MGTLKYLASWIIGYGHWVGRATDNLKSIESRSMRIAVILFCFAGYSILFLVITTPIWTLLRILTDFSVSAWLKGSVFVMLIEYAEYHLLGLALATIWPSKEGEFWLAKPFWLQT